MTPFADDIGPLVPFCVRCLAFSDLDWLQLTSTNDGYKLQCVLLHFGSIQNRPFKALLFYSVEWMDYSKCFLDPPFQF